MQKFTIFSAILTVVVLVLVVEILVNDYLPGGDARSGQANLVLDLPDKVDLTASLSTEDLGEGEDLPPDESVPLDLLPGTEQVSDFSLVESTKYLMTESYRLQREKEVTDWIAKTQPQEVSEGENNSENSVTSISGREYFASQFEAIDESLKDKYGDVPPLSTQLLDLSDTDPREYNGSAESTIDVINFADNKASDLSKTPLTSQNTSNLTGSDNQAGGDFENSNFVQSQNIYIRPEQLKSAGFEAAFMEQEVYDDYFFKNIYTGDIQNITVTKYVIRDQSKQFAKAYVISPGATGNINETYNLLKTRGASGVSTEVNETNQFGLSSFYMNDDTRKEVAFLTVKFKSLIYGFSYPKDNHNAIRNLIQLIQLERN